MGHSWLHGRPGQTHRLSVSSELVVIPVVVEVVVLVVAAVIVVVTLHPQVQVGGTVPLSQVGPLARLDILNASPRLRRVPRLDPNQCRFVTSLS